MLMKVLPFPKVNIFHYDNFIYSHFYMSHWIIWRDNQRQITETILNLNNVI